jgi:hypothetical protein
MQGRGGEWCVVWHLWEMWEREKLGQNVAKTIKTERKKKRCGTTMQERGSYLYKTTSFCASLFFFCN